MENIVYSEAQPIVETPKRPQFLTVICIITFVGCAFSLISAIWGYFSIQASAALIGNMDGLDGADTFGMMGEMQETMRKAVENAIPNLIVGIVCSLLCLFGAIQMWKLKKMGFYLYVVGEVTPIIAAFALGAGGMIAGAGVVFGALIATVWVVLYALNLKHMQ